MGLKYLYKEGEKPCTREPLKVKLNGTLVGEIRKVKDGFQYWPKGQKSGGDVFSSVSGVQNSLVSGQPVSKAKTDAKEDEGKDATVLADDLRKARKKIDKMTEDSGRALILLAAVVDLLDIQGESKTAVNVLEEAVIYDDTECDGHSLLEDIRNLLG